MSNYHSNITFNIDTWSALSPELTNIERWQDWANHQVWPEHSGASLNYSNIPPMVRRRMSRLSKITVSLALQLLEQYNVDYLVFSSQHGELHRSRKLIDDILSGEPASPMAFSQSVHNTAAGLTTIISKQRIPHTSISAGDNTFQSAIIEAWLYLTTNPGKKVLLIDFDEPLPMVYKEFEVQVFQPFALGLVLSSGDEYTLHKVETVPCSQKLPQGLDFIRQLLSSKNEWQIGSSNQTWLWKK
ncbi:3-oxoacyl-ACP synthase [Vibrio breoganii]|uniref:beta-ketoacyl synthase chain length factor n=1 Tax=Vibrio breoganii TaxID=553239 RepID=UPI000C82B776|nr:beta-ketoacyl synthase chain length factor [Vibrio breoganii]PMG39555.1 3-oxoacyl-ACP synthase [Vibrio breoganii]PMG82083.1 3-oxoacyl-ACP synthase [Vibrio breoganii]PMG93266.1 3-oxoacyl-ACP synthase [Vibrio breoganii]PMK39000.1 3-oxoacyl-ACP synthase [Vibrio breoganii]PML82612.1 3-oxoacyl-ACP synthase [Vibrio breoganii]